MKQITAILFWFTLGVNCFGQNMTLITWRTDSDANEFSFDIIQVSDNSILYHGSGFEDDSFYSMNYSFPDGTFRIELTDSGCNGFSGGGHMMLVQDNSVLWNIEGDYGCDNLKQSFFYYYDPCPANICPTDLDFDGLTGVSDLLIFIASYGTICN